MILSDKVQKILFGGDYNPEQWPEEVWEEDMRLFRLAHIDVVTLNVFSWAALQPDEDTYDFSRLDRIMELVKKKRHQGMPGYLHGGSSRMDGEKTSGYPARGADRNEEEIREPAQLLSQQPNLSEVFRGTCGEACGAL